MLGISDVSLDEHCYVYAHIPASEGLDSCKTLGFIAHMDTVSDFCDHPVTPVITENYDGGELPLGTSGRILSPEMFPHLSSLKGRTLITSDGTTILGADDKAGIAEIITALERILTEKILTALLPLPLLQTKRSAWDRHILTSENSVQTMPTLWMGIQKVRSSTKTSMPAVQKLFSRV